MTKKKSLPNKQKLGRLFFVVDWGKKILIVENSNRFDKITIISFANIRKLCDIATNPNSIITFGIERSLNLLKWRASLICPNTASGSIGRFDW